jgi:hypothetical protein
MNTVSETQRRRQWPALAIVVLAFAGALFALSKPAEAQLGPSVSGIFPTDGPSTGGTAVLITGTGFTGASSVTFGGTPAASFTVNSGTSISAVTPAHAPGFAQVQVTTPFGTSNDQIYFTFTGTGGGPIVSGLSPNAGPPSGGTTVVITGSGFTGVTAVSFGANPAASYTVNNSGQITAVSPAGTGTVNVRVTTGAGTSPATTANQFTYIGNIPVITGVSPNTGPVSGGTTVTITGSNFVGVTAVTFGAVAATSYIVDSATQIRAVSPSQGAGTVDIRVTNGAGTSAITAADQFTYTAGGPVISGLNPNSGPTGGGNSVTITGSGFVNVTAVQFGGINAAYVVNSNTSITATAPAHPAGTVNVRVFTTLGSSPLNAASQYTYGGTAPVVTGLNPASGPTTGGTVVVITGSGFSGATAVTFGGTAAVSFTVNSSTQVTAVAPPRSAGSVFVQVTTAAGTSVGTSSSTFTYSTGGPVVTGLSPSTGPVGGGNTVVITGTGFSGATAVQFGSANALSFTVNSDSQVTAIAPPGAAGTVFVRVVTPAGTSSQTVGSQYTYSGGPVVTDVSPRSGPTAGGTTVVITGTGFTGVTGVTFGGVNAPFTVNSSTRITVTAPARAAPGDVFVRVVTTGGTSAEVAAARFTYTATTSTFTYTLAFRWTLISWMGIDGIAISSALSGTGAASQVDSEAADQLTNISSFVTAIYRWDAAGQRWQAHFPGTGNIPGANDFNTFEHGRAYFIAITGPGPLTWVVQRGVPTN